MVASAPLAAFATGVVAGVVAERRLVRDGIVPLTPIEDRAEGFLVDDEVRRIPGPSGTVLEVASNGPRRPGVPQLVAAHGWLCTRDAWRPQVTALRDRARIVTYDQPLHGGSSGPDAATPSIDLLGDALLAVVRSATDPGPVVLAGHSMGGMAVLNALRRHGDELADRLAGIVLVSTAARAGGPADTFEFGLRRAARLRGLVGRAAPLLRHPLGLRLVRAVTRVRGDAAFLVARGSQGSVFDPGIAAHGLEMVHASGPRAVVDWLGPLLWLDEEAGLDVAARSPLTLVVGTRDRLTPGALSHRMARRTGARLVELPGVGHVTPLEAAETVTAVIAGHLGLDDDHDQVA